ncbi:MAG: RHS repeat-associated core domain-containing protein [Alphaproteobacteria bacterium]
MAGAGATTVAYKHNAFGERVSRVEGSTTTHFHYDQDGRLIAESDGTGVLVREYLWLGDKPLGLVVGPAGSPTLYYVHADHLERVQKITDATQAIVWDGQFTPYGRTHAIAGTVQNPLRFPGQWADPATNYFYNYMRDYDPTLARYLSVDPFGTGGGRNKYGYAGANPVSLVDPFGLQSESPRWRYYHHVVPRQQFQRADLPKAAYDVFNRAVVGPLGLHGYDTAHRLYNEAARDLWERCLREYKVDPRQMTASQAEKILTEFKQSSDPRMKPLREQISRAKFRGGRYMRLSN